MAPRNYWLIKSEPSTYSFTDLEKDKKTAWNGIRNFQARNFLSEVTKGDHLLLYHSGDDKAVVGIAEAIGSPYPEKTSDPKEKWVQVDISPVKRLKTPVTLQEIKGEVPLKNLKLIKHTRLSVMPVTAEEFSLICKMGGA